MRKIIKSVSVVDNLLIIDLSELGHTVLFLKKNNKFTLIPTNNVYNKMIELESGTYQLFSDEKKAVQYGLKDLWSRFILNSNNGIKITKDKLGNTWIKKEVYTSINRNYIFKTNIKNIEILKDKIIIEGISNFPVNNSIRIDQRSFSISFSKKGATYKKMFSLDKVTPKGKWRVELPLTNLKDINPNRYEINIFEDIDGDLFGSSPYYKFDGSKELTISNEASEMKFRGNDKGRLICDVIKYKETIENFEIKRLNNNDIIITLKESDFDKGTFVLKNKFFSLELPFKKNNGNVDIQLQHNKIKAYLLENNNNKFNLIYSVDGKNIEMKFGKVQQNIPEVIDNKMLFYISVGAKTNQIRYKKIKVLRNIKKVKFKTNKLIVQGNIIGLNTDIRQIPVSLSIVNRNTNKSVDNPISEFKKGFFFAIPHKTNLAEQIYNSFEISISLEYLIKNLKEGIWDFYIKFGNKKTDKYRKKMGFAFYDYKKDLVLDEIQYNNIILKASITPKGNLKIKTEKVYEKKELSVNKKQIWLVGERPDTAQENGLIFFRYILNNKKQITPYYIINEDSEDIANFSYKELKNVIFMDTERHYNVALQADAFIGTHDIEYFVPYSIDKINTEAKKIFLQHGVMGRKRAEYHKYYYKHPFDMVVVSSDEEKKMFEKEFKYHPHEITVAGLPRFDSLFKKMNNNTVGKEKYILVMPTWREWINFSQPFSQSEYFKKFRDLITNKRLQGILRDKKIKLLFYPHYRMQPYLHHFLQLENDVLKIVELGKITVQNLLVDAELLITDYSSVSFDMNFMEKPVIFYHFDEKRFFESGILRPIKETFIGDICQEEDLIVNSIESYIDNDFKEKKEIKESKKQVIKYNDNQNSERIYQAIFDAKRHQNIEWKYESGKRKIRTSLSYFVKYTPIFYIYNFLKNIKKE